MKRTVQKVAVLGAGVMGSGVAALLASAGMRVVLLDIVPNELTGQEQSLGITTASPEFRNKYAKAGLDRILNPKSGMLYSQEHGALISIGNMSDNMDMISDCDWIIEAVFENLDVKKQVMNQIAACRKQGSIISTNTSGVSVKEIVKDMPDEFRGHFLGTHFFNPPKIMRLFEMIITEDTLPEVTELMTELAQDILGKVVVFAKDTPNFIANRIGLYSLLDTMRLGDVYGYDIPTMDQLTGQVIGRPKSGTYRTCDMIGLDLLISSANTVSSNVNDPQEQERFKVPEILADLVKQGAFGDKVRRGFYTRTAGRELMYWNPKAKEYQKSGSATPEPVKKALASANTYEAIVYGDAPENKLVWELIRNVVLFSAAKVPEIADDYKMIDQAMIWGYNWRKGPFQIWDAIGVERSVARMKQEGCIIPAWVEARLSEGKTMFYDKIGEASPYIKLADKTAPPVISNEDASLRDIGDGVLCLEFHSKGNTITNNTMNILRAAIEELDKDWAGMVIGNRGKNFSTGANLGWIASVIDDKRWDTISDMVVGLQSADMALKYAPKPVVAAPFAMTLGGGAECAMHCFCALPHADTNMGLVETGVGLIPGGGGCKEYLVKSFARVRGQKRQDLIPELQNAWRGIFKADVSRNAFDAIAKGLISDTSKVIMNPDALLDTAKDKVLELAKGYKVPAPAAVPLLGDYGRAILLEELNNMYLGGFVSEYDVHIAKKLAFVLTGGRAVTGTVADENCILELEREAFVSLCGEVKTRQRIAYMLSNGKPLKN